MPFFVVIYLIKFSTSMATTVLTQLAIKFYKTSDFHSDTQPISKLNCQATDSVASAIIRFSVAINIIRLKNFT
jgi:hypothetical protein